MLLPVFCFREFYWIDKLRRKRIEGKIGLYWGELGYFYDLYSDDRLLFENIGTSFAFNDHFIYHR